MTPRAPESSFRKQLRSQYGAVRRAAILRHALRAAAWAGIWITLAVVLGVVRPMGVAGAWLRHVALAASILAALTVAVWRARLQVPAFDAFLESIERKFPALRSLLRNALDLERSGTPHTSGELAGALLEDAARQIAGAPIASLRPAIRPRAPLAALGACALLLAAVTIANPSGTQRSWRTLFEPDRAAPPVTLVVEPGSVRLSPGATLSIHARVTGTGLAPRLVRGGARAPEAIEEPAVSPFEHHWRFDLPPITREERYRVRVAAVTSPAYTIALSGEPQPLSFDIEYRPPAYARLPVQRGSATRGDLSALRGTRAAIEIMFDRDLTALDAAASGMRAVRFQPLSPRRWRGTIMLDRDGEWSLAATASSGASRFRYAMHALPDAAPVLAVRLPEGDQDLPAGQQVPIEVFGQDDLGLSALDLESHKDAASPWHRAPLARFEGEPREAHVAKLWDASSLGLLPGENASFRFVLYDNDAFGRGMATSPTFTLRFPSLADLYQNVSQRQEVAQGTLEKVAEQSRELQKKLDQLSRQAAAPSSNAFERREEFKSALDRQQDLSRRVDQAAQDLRQSLEQAAERRAFSEELEHKLHELQRLVSQIESPEFREALKRIQQALENLDRRALEQSLPDWKRENQEMLKNIERTTELLKRLREEERLDSLARRAEDLKRQQDALNREHEERASNPSADSRGEQKPPSGADSSRRAEATPESKPENLAARQENAAEQSKKLGSDVQDIAQQSESGDEKSELEEASKQLDQEAAESQRQSAQAASEGESQKARAQGESASQSLESARQKLARLAQKLSDQRQGVDLAAVRRGAQDLLSLQRGSEANLGSPEPLDHRADRATDLSDGVARVADSLATLSRRTPFITPRLSQALGRAIEQLGRSGREMGGGDRQEGERAGRDGSLALTEAVLHLREAENSMCKSPAATPGGPSQGQQVSQLGERQGQVNQQTREIARRLTEQMRLTAGDQSELHRLAEEQQRIREQLESLQRDEDRDHPLLGRLDAARRDMKDVEESLRQGPPGDELEQKEQRILSRLLDAARSVNRRDYDPARESRPGEDALRSSPGAIPLELMRESDRLRLDLLKAEADRYPARYRAFVEAYLRALNGAPR